MFKVLITAIKPSILSPEHIGTYNLIPDRLSIDGDRFVDIMISVNSDRPYKSGATTYEGSDKALLSEWLPDQYGMYGKRVGDDAKPIDLVAALTAATWLEWEIISGKEILDLPVPPLPPGAIS
jgi:hypothetical protein